MYIATLTRSILLQLSPMGDYEVTAQAQSEDENIKEEEELVSQTRAVFRPNQVMRRKRQSSHSVEWE